MNRGRVRRGTCRSRAPDVAGHAVPSKLCTRMYSHAAKNTATYVHTAGVSNAYSRIRPGLVYIERQCGRGNGQLHWMVGVRSNGVLFIGSQPAGSERLKRRPVHREPTGWGETAETGSCSSTDPAHRLGCGVPQNGRNGVLFIQRQPPTVETGSCSSGGVWRTAERPPRDTVHPMHKQPTTSTGSCSSTPNRLGCGVPRHDLLGVLFIQCKPPTTTGSCSSNPHLSELNPADLR